MSWLIDYCNKAEQTDRLVENSNHIGLLTAGLYGEIGSVLAELKKIERESGAYPSVPTTLIEEFGDILWYLVRLMTVLVPSERQKLEDLELSASSQAQCDALTDALALGAAAGVFITSVQERDDTAYVSQLSSIWQALLRLSSTVGIDLSEAADQNLQKTLSRWPSHRRFYPLFDDGFEVEEQLPRILEVKFRETTRGSGRQKVVLLRCNRLNLGDRLTDNISDADFYRYHDVFHFAHAVYLGWSPVMRVLLKCKRKSDPRVDENQDRARASIIEEAVTATVFSRAKELNYYEDTNNVDYDLLKTISGLVRGFEVDRVPVWQWEEAILNGYRVFRSLSGNCGGTVTLDLIERRLRYSKPNPPQASAESVSSCTIDG